MGGGGGGGVGDGVGGWSWMTGQEVGGAPLSASRQLNFRYAEATKASKHTLSKKQPEFLMTHSYCVQHIPSPAKMQDHYISCRKRSETPTRDHGQRTPAIRARQRFVYRESTERVIVVIVTHSVEMKRVSC